MELILYSAPWCRDCQIAKKWLAEHKIAYKEINIEEVPGAAQEVIRRTGKRAIPQFVFNNQWIQPYEPGRGFKYAEMAQLFGIGASADRDSPPQQVRTGSAGAPGVEPLESTQ